MEAFDNYYAVFRVNYTETKGRELAKLCDINHTFDVLRGFNTKRKMMEFVEEYKGGFNKLRLLKPIS
jgi:hypothetical protein